MKKRVKAHHGHTIEIGRGTLKIKILPDSELAMVDAAGTNNAISSVSTSNFLPLQNDFKNKHEEIYAAGYESGRKKVDFYLTWNAYVNSQLSPYYMRP